MDSLKEAGKELARWRKELGLTFREAGLRAGVNWQQIQKMETDPRRPSLAFAAALAKAYGRTPTDMAVLFGYWEPDGGEQRFLQDIISIARTRNARDLELLWIEANKIRLGI